MPVLLLTTVGRHSAQPRTVVVGFARDGDDLVVLGSNSGLPQAPSWALNLRAHPEAQIEIARQRWPVRGEWMDGPERERLWQLVVGRYPVFRSYQRKTTRPIPVIRLRPTDGPA
jgi:deazaflavin-dependent oxidoreductase (nitroreductase family)